MNRYDDLDPYGRPYDGGAYGDAYEEPYDDGGAYPDARGTRRQRGGRRGGRGRSRRRRRLLVMLLVVLGLLGSGVAAGGLYVSSVTIPDELALPQTTIVYYADGKTVMARLGEANRTVIDVDTLPAHVAEAVIATEDAEFWSGSLTKISRSYARLAAGVKGDSIPDKAKVATLAWKLEDSHSKPQILALYLNSVPFGRGAYGIEAAAKAYFGKSGKDLGLEEAMVLAGVITQPDGAYDPAVNPSRAESRLRAVRQSMISAGYLDEARAATVGMPQTVRYDPRAISAGLAKPTGLVVSHALSEMRQSEPFKNTSWDQFRNGGYAVVTTVDARAQALLEATADETVAGSVMSDEPTNLQAAAVVVQPGTGRVLAYYGGHSGTGADFAGWYYDADGVPTGYGAHPAGPTFQVYALAAALRDGISVRSWWDARSPKEFPPVRVGKLAVRNTGTCPTGRTACTLADSTLASLNTPYYALTERLGPAKVIEMAHAVGIDFIWTDADPAKRSRVDLAAKPASELVPQPFATDVGLGQYPVTVLDQANGMATLAANRRARAHFVSSVSKDGRVLQAEQLPRDAQPVLNQAQSADLTWTLGRTAAGKLKGRDSATKTGSWPLGRSTTDTAHAWIVGFTGELAMAVWIGNDGEEKAIEDVKGKAVTGSTLPALIYRTFMTGAYSRLAIKATTKFRKPTYVGDDTAGNVRPPT